MEDQGVFILYQQAAWNCIGERSKIFCWENV